MKNASISAKKLSALLKKIAPLVPAVPPDFALPCPLRPAGPADAAATAELPSAATMPAPMSAMHDPVAVLVMSMLMWESTTEKALAAYERLAAQLVDLNDLRVCMPHETLELIGPRYPRALDRCQRLRAMLRNIYLREHAVSLNRLATTNKREVKKYIESLEGIVPYAASRLLLLSFDVHAIPVDDQLRIQLIDADVSDAAVEVPELSAWLAAQIKPGEALAAHHAFQAWIDEIAGGEKKSLSKRSPGRKTSTKRESGGKAKATAS